MFCDVAESKKSATFFNQVGQKRVSKCCNYRKPHQQIFLVLCDNAKGDVMNSAKRVCSIVLLTVLAVTALCTLSACSIADLKSGINVHKDGMYYTVYVLKHCAIVHGFDVKGGAQVYEIPSRVKYKGVKYPVTRFSTANNDSSYYVNDIVSGGYAVELVIPETLEEMHFYGYRVEQLDFLQKVTVVSNNPYYTSVDGVVYSKDKSELVFYPPAKVDNSLILPRETTNIRDYIRGKKQLSSISVEAGNTTYSAKDGVLFDANGSKILCYPLNKTDETFVIPKTMSVLYAVVFADNHFLKYLEVEQGNPVFSAYKGSLYSADGAILLYHQHQDELNVLELPDTIKTIGKDTLEKIDCLYVPRGLQRIVFDKYDNYYGYSDENDRNPISNVGYVYFEDDEVPFCLRYAKLTQNVKFGVTREEFEAEMQQRFNEGGQL